MDRMCKVVTLSLVKGGHKHVFRYEPGQEIQMIERLVGLIDEPEALLDWFDVAILAYQMGQKNHG